MKGFLRMKAQEIDHAALRQRFNPDGSLLRRQQMRMLEILLEVDRICKKHDIKYWLSSGTLIGAARHKGFIPWDDDLDIEMLWDDYKRLMKVLPDELPETMALQNTKTDPNYFCFYAKVRDRRSHLEESNRYDRVWREQGIYIDVFPFYRQPLWIHMLSEKAQGHVYKIMNRRRPTRSLPHREGGGRVFPSRLLESSLHHALQRKVLLPTAALLLQVLQSPRDRRTGHSFSRSAPHGRHTATLADGV